MALLGFITPLIAFILLVIGVAALLLKGVIGSYARAITGIIPIGNAKLWAIIFIVVGLVMGGITYGGGLFSSTTAAIVSPQAEETTPVGELQLQNCYINAISATAPGVNVTFRADPYDRTHYYVDLSNATLSNGADINGTINCERSLENVDKSQSTRCELVSASFTNKDSSTDTAIYRMVSLSAGNSQVSGVPAGFVQDATLNDGSVASSSSNKEVTTWTMTGGSSAQSQDTLGFWFSLPSSTNINYLNNQDSVDNVINCGGKQLAKLTVVKVTE